MLALASRDYIILHDERSRLEKIRIETSSFEVLYLPNQDYYPLGSFRNTTVIRSTSDLAFEPDSQPALESASS